MGDKNGQVKEKESIKNILSCMSEGPGPSDLDLPQVVSSRLPKKDSIRAWRKPKMGLEHKRQDKRFHFVADVLLSNKEKTIIGKAINISHGGIFIATDASIFQESDVLDITIVPLSAARSYQTKATVIRKIKWPVGSKGYALTFDGFEGS